MKLVTLLYRRDGSDFRVWNTTWFGDVFEVLSANEFDALRTMCNRFGIPLVEADD